MLQISKKMWEVIIVFQQQREDPSPCVKGSLDSSGLVCRHMQTWMLVLFSAQINEQDGLSLLLIIRQIFYHNIG